MLHGPFTPQHPQRELVDSRLEHRPELPVHEAGLVQPVILGYDLLRSLQLDETRLVKRRRLPGYATQPAGCTLLGCGTLLKTLADPHISRGDETLLLGWVRAVRMPPGDGGEAAPEKTTVPVQAGLDSDVPLQVFAPGLLDAPAAACRRRRGQMFQPNTFPLRVLVAVVSVVNHKGFLSNVLRQAVEPLAHGRL